MCLKPQQKTNARTINMLDKITRFANHDGEALLKPRTRYEVYFFEFDKAGCIQCPQRFITKGTEVGINEKIAVVFYAENIPPPTLEKIQEISGIEIDFVYPMADSEVTKGQYSECRFSVTFQRFIADSKDLLDVTISPFSGGSLYEDCLVSNSQMTSLFWPENDIKQASSGSVAFAFKLAWKYLDCEIPIELHYRFEPSIGELPLCFDVQYAHNNKQKEISFRPVSRNMFSDLHIRESWLAESSVIINLESLCVSIK